MSEENMGVGYDPDSVNKLEERWYNWKTLAGIVYLIICLVDFVAMPIIVQVDYAVTKTKIEELIRKNPDRKFVLDVIDRVKVQQWEPTTLSGGGLFHLAFGGILTGGVILKGLERKEAIKKGTDAKP